MFYLFKQIFRLVQDSGLFCLIKQILEVQVSIKIDGHYKTRKGSGLAGTAAAGPGSGGGTG